MNFFKSASFRRCFCSPAGATTIFSLSSAPGKCGVSVIRVSGPQTQSALRAIVKSKHDLKERYVNLKSFHHPKTNEMIDRGFALWFPGPASFTGEDSCEFQVHGSLAVVAAMLDALGSVPGLRPAGPGEFTKRAFFGGKLDLTEVDGLADLIHAETEAQRKQALLQSTGALARVYDGWRRRLIRCAAHMEAYIDFAEEENIETDVVVQMERELRRLIEEMRAHLDDQRQGEMLRDGVRTAIVGAPNVGKSSFLNLLCQRPVSIVTPVAGTTRDVIETTYNFGGFPVVFSDTAGLRPPTDDIVELEGMARARQCVETADLILLIMDAQQLVAQAVQSAEQLQDYVRQYLKQLDLTEEAVTGGSKKLKLVINKIDLLSAEEQAKRLQPLKDTLQISCTTEANLPQFLTGFQGLLQDLCGQPTSENPRITHTRYRQGLERCIEHILVFLKDYSPDHYPDLAISAQKLRKAVRAVEQITGHVSTDDILDVVFRDFCIGK